MALNTIQALIFIGLLASTSCLAQAPSPSPTMILPPVESPSPTSPDISPMAEPPTPVASPPVHFHHEPTVAPATPPTFLPPKVSPMASPPKSGGLAPGSTPTPSPAPAPETPEADSALTNKAFIVSTVIAGALYAVVLA